MACVKETPLRKTDSHDKLVYIPPKRGSPLGRVAGGTRGPQDPLHLIALAPDHPGLTVHEQPALYWDVSSSTSHRVKFTLINADTNLLVTERYLPSRQRAGIQVIRLDEHEIRLAIGVPYRWLVTLEYESHTEHRFAGGVIERTPASPGLSAKLREACPFELPAIYLSEGLWYDALTALIELMTDAPQDRQLQKQYATLLEQAGLTDIQGFDEIIGP